MSIKTKETFDMELNEMIESSDFMEFNSSFLIEGSKLGSGAFGKVFLGIYKSLKLAIKRIKEYNSKNLFREIYIMKKVSHPYIPLFYGVIKKWQNKIPIPQPKYSYNNVVKNIQASGEKFKTEKNLCSGLILKESTIDIIIEIVEGTTLETMIKSKQLNEIEKNIILLDLATVITYIHDQKIIHRDLKPSNIMISKKYQLKLLDFGISKLCSKGKNWTKTESIGTMCYMAPENFNISGNHSSSLEEASNKSASNEISDKVDIWAFGCIVQELISGVKPWNNIVETNNNILGLLYCKNTFEITNLIDKNSKYRILIEKCVKIIPEKRINIKEIKEILLQILFETIISKTKNNSGLDSVQGILSLFKNSISQNFNLLRKLEFYLFEYYHLQIKNKNPKELLNMTLFDCFTKTSYIDPKTHKEMLKQKKENYKINSENNNLSRHSFTIVIQGRIKTVNISDKVIDFCLMNLEKKVILCKSNEISFNINSKKFNKERCLYKVKNVIKFEILNKIVENLDDFSFEYKKGMLPIKHNSNNNLKSDNLKLFYNKNDFFSPKNLKNSNFNNHFREIKSKSFRYISTDQAIQSTNMSNLNEKNPHFNTPKYSNIYSNSFGKNINSISLNKVPPVLIPNQVSEETLKASSKNAKEELFDVKVRNIKKMHIMNPNISTDVKDEINYSKNKIRQGDLKLIEAIHDQKNPSTLVNPSKRYKAISFENRKNLEKGSYDIIENMSKIHKEVLSNSNLPRKIHFDEKRENFINKEGLESKKIGQIKKIVNFREIIGDRNDSIIKNN